jgi:acyl-homoserine-lactone acylase
VLNPSSGFLQNCNSTPFLTSGSDNPERSRYPAYMAPDPDTLRAQRSRQILSQTEKFTFESWAAASMDTHLLLAEMLVPDLARIAVSMQPEQNAQTFLEPLMELSKWDFKSSIESTQTTVFMNYFEQLQRANQQRNRSAETNQAGPARTLPEQLMSLEDSVKFEAFKKAVTELNDSFGTWKVKWGDVNRLQRIHTSGSVEKFNDAKPSVPIAGANGQTGCILTFGTRREDGQKKRYGISGNSYLAVVEFGPRVKRRSLLVFGQDADPSSPHHFDQAEHYSKKEYKPAWFDLSEIKANSKQNYKPGYKK